jgi:hypothetical protein
MSVDKRSIRRLVAPKTDLVDAARPAAGLLTESRVRALLVRRGPEIAVAVRRRPHLGATESSSAISVAPQRPAGAASLGGEQERSPIAMSQRPSSAAGKPHPGAILRREKRRLGVSRRLDSPSRRLARSVPPPSAVPPPSRERSHQMRVPFGASGSARFPSTSRASFVRLPHHVTSPESSSVWPMRRVPTTASATPMRSRPFATSRSSRRVHHRCGSCSASRTTGLVVGETRSESCEHSSSSPARWNSTRFWPIANAPSATTPP